ncbi:hypothetical protein CL6EHI_098510 [Entamoeba histolytica]|uniref:Serine-threonine-isoleucine rich protein n=2 Tax=Entamoeba histolytica TaxID=5759 RepID=C4LXD1_ENTH1|nr:hypothetical protein EHI_098510 [Entamoeba histolytica HM-1:IMSS]EAL50641.1 hypothetical protein EHI_098510 [Entamoeba histolytica HM-1:IMSS]GAT93408.1 hypothetical protein CL6EHI_098510 [Entamoeba histolytica]|eukprot:XP_656027.1 hypothetical protein EHI_098510 [Entamoeba histolytica HM-1:IMSS]
MLIIFLFTLFTLIIATPISCNSYQSQTESQTDIELTMSFGCYFIVTSQTTFKSISGEGTVVINGAVEVTVNDFKGGIIQLNHENAKVNILKTTDLSTSNNSKYQKKIVGKGTTVIKPQNNGVTINLDMIGSTSLAVESVQQYFKLVVGTLYLNKDIDVGKYCELSVSQLTSTVTNEKRSIKTSGKRMVITEIDADLYRLVEPTQVIISAVPITETYSNVVKCTLDGTFVTGTDLVCPCQSLTGYECELEFTGSTNPITFPKENIALHKLTLPRGATISGTGSLSVMNLEIKGDVTINGFSSVDINSQTGESKITISTNGKLKGTKSKTVTFSPSSSSVKLEYYGTSVETLTVDKEGTFINSGNNINTVTLSNSGKYTVPEGITVNSGTINVCPTCVVNINGEYTESLKIQSTGTKDNTNNDYNVIFGMFKDFVEKVVTSTGTNKITFHPSGKKVIFKEMDYSSTNELIDGCDYTNTFYKTNTKNKCASMKVEGIEPIEVSLTTSDVNGADKFIIEKGLSVNTSKVIFKTCGTIKTLKFLLSDVTLTKPNGQSSCELTVTEGLKSETKETESLSPELKVTLDNIQLKNTDINVPKLVLKSAIITANKDIKIPTLSMDGKSKINLGQYGLNVEEVSFDFSDITESNKQDSLINSNKDKGFVVEKIMTVSSTPKPEVKNIYITKQDNTITYSGDVPNKFYLACYGRALIYNIDTKYKCDEVFKTPKKCTFKTGETDIDFNSESSYNEALCPCHYSDPKGEQDLIGSCQITYEENKERKDKVTIRSNSDINVNAISVNSINEVTISASDKKIISKVFVLGKRLILEGSSIKLSEIHGITDSSSTSVPELELKGKSAIETITGNMNIITSKEAVIEKGHTTENYYTGLDVKGTLNIRTGSTFEATNIKVYKTNTISSKVTVSSTSTLNLKRIEVVMDVVNEEPIFTGDVPSRITGVSSSNMTISGASSSICQAIGSFSSSDNSRNTFIKSGMSDLGCSSKLWIVCSKKTLSYKCPGNTQCTFKASTTTLNASDKASYIDQENCPCSEAGSEIFTTGCETNIPSNVSGIIKDMKGSIETLTVDTDRVEVETSNVLSISTMRIRGVNQFKGSQAIKVDIVDIFTSLPTRVTFDNPVSISATQLSGSSVFFFFKNEASIILGTSKGQTIKSGASVSLSSTLSNDQKIEVITTEEMKEADLFISSNKQVKLGGSLYSKTLTITNTKETTDEEAMFMIPTGKEFNANNLKVVSSYIKSYKIVETSDINYVNIGEYSDGVYIDKYKSYATYGTKGKRSSDIICSMKKEGIQSGVIAFDDKNTNTSWDRAGCSCDGESCQVNMISDIDYRMTGINYEFVKNLFIKNGNDLKTYTSVLEGDKIQGEIIEIDTGNVEFRVGKIQMNKLTIQKESNISFIGIKNTSTIENIVLIKPGTTSILVKDGVNPLTLKINNDNNTLNSITLQNSSRVIISNTQTTINLGEVNIENSQLYLDSGNYEFNEKTINFLVNSNDFMMVMGPSTQINSNSREIKTMNFNIKIEKELEGPIYLLRTSYQNFISRFGVKFTITSNNHLKGKPTNSIDSKYELTQVCRIYVALVPKGYTITECPKDPCGTNEAGISSQITNGEVPAWAIAVIVIVGVIIVIALILLVAFILYAKLVLLKNRKNNKVFDDTENIFCASEVNESDDIAKKEEGLDNDGEISVSSESASGSASSSYSSNGSGSSNGSDVGSGSASE